MKCLVLGGAGFIGSHLVDGMVAAGHHVRMFDLPNISLKNLQNNIKQIDMVCGDFNNIEDVSRALKGMDVVVHLVSLTLPGPSNENPIYDVESNVVCTLRLLERSLQAGVKKIVFASSGGTVYGIPKTLPIPETHATDPICSYGITKLTIEKYLNLFDVLHGLTHVVLRLGNPYGERQKSNNIQGAVSVFLGKALKDEEIVIWGDGSVARDYFYIQDLINAFVKAIESDTPSNIYNIASGTATSLKDLIATIEQITGKNLKVRYVQGRKFDVPANCLDVTLAFKELKWRPEKSLTEGIKRTWMWLKRQSIS